MMAAYRCLLRQCVRPYSSSLRMTPIHYPFRYWLEHADRLKQDIQSRNVNANLDRVLALYRQRTRLTARVNELRHVRHVLASSAQASSQTNGLPSRGAAEGETDAKKVKSQLSELENELREIERELYQEAAYIPNESDPTSPVGNEQHNELVYTNYTAELSDRGFPIQTHLDIGARLELFDFKAGAKASGSGFYYLKNDAVLLEFALIQYALQKACAHGFTPMTTPDLVRRHYVQRCGFLPRTGQALKPPPIYHLASLPDTLHDEYSGLHSSSSPTPSLDHGLDLGYEEPMNELALIGTSEIPLAAYHANETLSHASLPQKYVAFSHCFRPEAGSSGKDTKGLYRVHQFSKVELFVVTTPNAAESTLAEIVELQKEIFLGLGFQIRILNMATEELGAASYKKYDIEAWMPGRGGWGEVSSASNCQDYQSRRLNIRYRNKEADALHFPATLNGTAISIPRAILTLLENGQQKDGTVVLPASLAPWLPRLTLTPRKK